MRTYSYEVDVGHPKGVCDLKVSATDAGGTSRATAKLEIF